MDLKAFYVIENGAAFPAQIVKFVSGEDVSDIATNDLFGQGRHVLFSLPGAFTPTCSDMHLPGYVLLADQLHAKGIGRIVCLTVNDHHVIKAWAKAAAATDVIDFIADGNADLAKALGIDRDLSAASMGVRAGRAAFVITDGIVEAAFTENKPGVVTSSGAPAIVEFLG